MKPLKNKRERLRQYVRSSESLFNIAAQNQHLPAVRQALDNLNKPYAEQKSSPGSFSSFFCLLSKTHEHGRHQQPEHRKVRSSTGMALWMTFVNLADNKKRDESEQQAINLILGPVADALALNISERKIKRTPGDNKPHISGLTSPDIALLTDTAEAISRGVNSTWITEENLPPIKRLRKVAVSCWIDMYKLERNL